MGQTTLSVRLDEDIKRRFDYICADIGMNASVAVNVFIRAVLREKSIPFELKGNDDPFYNIKTQERLREAMAELECGENLVVKSWDELKAMENE